MLQHSWHSLRDEDTLATPRETAAAAGRFLESWEMRMEEDTMVELLVAFPVALGRSRRKTCDSLCHLIVIYLS